MASGPYHSYSFLYLFYISITLTQKGLAEIGRILAYVFQYTALLRDVAPLQRYYEEEAQIAHTDFRYKEKQNSTTFVSAISSRMHQVPVQFLLNDHPYRDFDADGLSTLTQLLVPEHCFAILSTKADVFPAIHLTTDPIYGTPYGKSDVSSNGGPFH